MEEIKVKDVHVTDKFWTKYINLVKDVVVPYQWYALNDRVEDAEPSHSIMNFKIAAGIEKGEFQGYVFQDSDLYKWIEAASYILASFKDSALDKTLDEAIELIGKAQQPDGYINTYFTIKEPDKRWANERDKHELYCAGHLIEAAVAHFEATGKDNLINIACKFADYIYTVFGKSEGKKHGYPGHQVIELALLRLYRVTYNKKYLDLCKYFIDERGKKPNYFTLEREERAEKFGEEIVSKEPYNDLMSKGYEYNQAHLPVREQKKAVGHAVRAMYMYTAMADLASETNDKSLIDAVKTLWKDVTECQMYITAGVGSNGSGEAFSFDYDLPNDEAYAETCASVGLVFWAQKMLKIQPDSKYSDIIEKAIYNGTISGISLNGKRFFYVNPLEVFPEACKKRLDKADVAVERQKWFGCACCPPNISRLIASIGKYIYTIKDDDTIYVHLYIGNTTDFKIKGQNLVLSQSCNYPWDGNIKITVSTSVSINITLAMRIPGWCENAEVKLNDTLIDCSSSTENGYVMINRTWNDGDCVEMIFPMEVEKMHANPCVREDAGRIAIQRGPVVYCLEEEDNGTNLSDISISKDSSLKASFNAELLGGIMEITGQGEKSDIDNLKNVLYSKSSFKRHKVNIKAVPYFAWANRKPGEMLVWIRES